MELEHTFALAPVVAIVGSRDYTDLAAVERFVVRLQRKYPGATVISGGAHGVDAAAEQAARAVGLALRVYPAQWQRFGRGAGVRRNAEMVAAASVVVAFWDGASKGTEHTIELARRAGKQLVVFGDKGIGT